MDYRRIIVFLDSGASSDARMDFAIDFATRRNAHVTAVYVAHRPPVPYPAEAGFGSPFAELDRHRDARRTQLEHRFVDAMVRAGLSFDWQSLRPAEAHAAPVLARPFDLAIVGQPDPGDLEFTFARGFPESVVIDSGRPVLMTPHTRTNSASIRRIMVAWNDSREAALAIAGALPLLRGAEIVRVVTVDPDPDSGKRTSLMQASIASWLSRHGVKTEVVQSGPIKELGEWLLTMAHFLQSDLIVAGTYGHSRLREFVLGGVSRTLFRSAPVPVLMSH